jgi:hypothetical protein
VTPRLEAGHERIEAHRGEAVGNTPAGVGDDALDGRRVGVDVESNAIARLPPEELIGGHAEVLPGDVPQRNIDGAECGAHRGAAELGVPVEELPVMLDLERVFASKVRGPRLDHPLRRRGVAPHPRLAEPGEPVVGVDLEVHPSVADQVRVDLLDLQRARSSVRVWCLCSRRRAPSTGIMEHAFRRGVKPVGHCFI